MLFTAEEFVSADAEHRRERLARHFAHRSMLRRLRRPTQVAVPPSLSPAGAPIIVAQRVPAKEYVSV